MSVVFEPKELKMTLMTNIPIGKEYEKALLTIGTLYRPGLQNVKKIRTNSYPYFTHQVSYSGTTLSTKTYDELLEIFFDIKEFKYQFGSIADMIPFNTDGLPSEIIEKQRRNIDNNVMLMIKYLLPTKFPVVNNHFSSYDLLNGRDSLTTFFFNPFLPRPFIYLKLRGGTYTVVEAIWLSDVKNHPDYSKYMKVENNTSNDNSIEQKEKNLTLKSSNLQLSKNTTTPIRKVRSCYTSSCAQELSDMQYTGVQINNDNYELSVYVELIESELKETDVGNVYCPYFGDYLGEEFERLVKKAIGKTKIDQGRIVVKPLFSATTKTSKKLGYVEKEKISEKTKAKRAADEEEYNEEEEEEKREYELLIKKFLVEALGKYKTKMKKYDITKQNFYNFLKRESFKPLLDFVKTYKEIKPREEALETLKGIQINGRSNFGTAKKQSIDEYISSKDNELRERKERRQISKEELEEKLLRNDLVRDFVKFISKSIESSLRSTSSTENVEPQDNRGTGGTRKKRAKKRSSRKKRSTRRKR
jgi:hypothetical protein